MQSSLPFNTLTDGSTVAVDWNVSQNHVLTPGGNRTLTFSNGKSGSRYVIKITQDSTGSRLITWPSTVKWAGGSAPTLTTTVGRTDFVEFIFDGTYYLDVNIVKNFNLA